MNHKETKKFAFRIHHGNEILRAMSSIQNALHKDWVLVEGVDEFKGVRIATSGMTGIIVSLSTSRCNDCDRWKDVTPPLSDFPALVVLDLDRSHYLKTLHESVGNLKHLKVVNITRCTRLERVPGSICGLASLQEVSVCDESLQADNSPLLNYNSCLLRILL